MAYLVLVINSSNDSIQTLNDKTQFATKSYESVEGCRNVLEAILAGATDAVVQVTTRDTDPSVSTSGTGSAQNSFNLS